MEKKSKTMQTSEESVDRLVMARMIPPKNKAPYTLAACLIILLSSAWRPSVDGSASCRFRSQLTSGKGTVQRELPKTHHITAQVTSLRGSRPPHNSSARYLSTRPLQVAYGVAGVAPSGVFPSLIWQSVPARAENHTDRYPNVGHNG